ncbi:MAG: hypothetical protein QOJ64_2545 [Acidobacteriota bacterium]|jgi:uncharacterized protein YndB with AHSA1/START domain|nr:hypothetical protein [Acidobacteriota bacterium]
MFTVNHLLKRWLTELAEVEARLGGKYELSWRPDDRENDSPIGCRITAIEADKFLAFEWGTPERFKSFAHDADPLTQVVVFFLPEGNKTHVHLIHSGWRSSSNWEEARQWQQNAWSTAFLRLEHMENAMPRRTPRVLGLPFFV